MKQIHKNDYSIKLYGLRSAVPGRNKIFFIVVIFCVRKITIKYTNIIVMPNYGS